MATKSATKLTPALSGISLTTPTPNIGGTSSSNSPVYAKTGKVIKFATNSCYISDKANRTATCSYTFDSTKNKYLDHYEIIWHYYTPSNKKWDDASKTTTTKTFSTYSIPATVSLVKCSVMPVQKDKYKGKAIKKADKWKGGWSTSAYADIGTQEATPDTPSNLKMEIIGTKMTLSVDNYNYDGAIVKFEVIQDGTKKYKTLSAPVKFARASVTTTVDTGHRYAARCIGELKGRTSLKWSNYTDYMPTAPGKVNRLTAETQEVTKEENRYRVKLAWSAAQNVYDPSNDKYEVQYAKKEEYFDVSPDDVQSKDVSDSRNIPLSTIIIPSEQGTWFFRVRGVNSNGGGEWSNNASASVGLPPEAPTTWSYTSSVKIGEDVIFNWTHNSADGSKQTAAQIIVKVNDVEQQPIPITGEDKTYKYKTAGLPDGTTILWKVKTKGAHPDFSEESVEREVKIYEEPSVAVAANLNSFVDDVLVTFPLEISVEARPQSQKLISMDFSIISEDEYTISDDSGHLIHVTAGDTVYTYRADNPSSNTVGITITPSDVNFSESAAYKAVAVVYMSSGIQASGELEFSTGFDENEFEPEGSVEIDYETLTASIYPFIRDEFGAPVRKGAKLGVFRQNFDGTFTELENDIPLNSSRSVTDEHPTLDYARYRITARSEKTGRISYVDLAPEEVNVASIVIQWSDDWYFEGEDVSEYHGEMLFLPYNVDVSDSNNMDVSLIEYIGREHPVSYYGTQKGYSSNWKCDIRKDDSERLYAIRRLARFAGDVYVREPSGAGYWANIKVQYSVNHNSLSIPVSFTVTRVEGGA